MCRQLQLYEALSGRPRSTCRYTAREVVGRGCKLHPRCRAVTGRHTHACARARATSTYARADGAVGNCLMLLSTYMWRSSSS
jgi:hypothetical protein